MEPTLYEASGVLRYRSKSSLVLEVQQQLADYYRSLIPKYLPTNRPRWPAHITIVREEKEFPVFLEHWGKYEGESIRYWYSPEIHQGKVYYWLNTFCIRLEEIRIELGLPCVSQYTLPPEGFRKCFHMTVANCKDVP